MPNTKTENKIWDVVVIGAGPAGMMAAGRAGERGKKVLLLEKNTNLGKKLLITGGGRCNLTNNKPDNRTLLAKYKGNDQFLFSAFSQFDVTKTLSFFNDNGMATKEENEGRIFPVSDSSQSVLDVLYNYMQKNNVVIHKSTNVRSIEVDKKTGDIVISTASGNTIHTKACVLATGGTSRPETGSTGEGFQWLKKLNHTIVDNNFALVPVALNDDWIKDVAGVKLTDIKLTTFQNNKKQEAYKGKLLFTHVGISGPTVLNMSKDIGELLKYGEVEIKIDLFPNRDNRGLKQDLQNILVAESNKKLKNVLNPLIPASLQTPILNMGNIDGETYSHSVSSEDRVKLVEIMKAIPLHVKGLLGKEKAIVSSGGVDLKEVDFKTMQSRLIPNLYLVGDVLNIDRPSGGYSLQLCWTTGFVAGDNC
ncbi:TPA: aminoacetone oxidase family FAD-binding enzyme [Candidatus Nomurabacteria bacterium]|nr:aminoacetone oxidase family FAD-binding enzyme [Candidatus Nomurabacteria bacterium]